MVTRAKWTEREQMAAMGALFDGEGCVHIGRPHGRDHYHSLRARISMTDAYYPHLFAEKFGGTARETTAGRKAHYRTVYHWAVASAQAGAFFEAILPWVVIKRPQVEIALRLRTLMGRKGSTPVAKTIEERWNCYWEIRKLNTGPHVQRLSEEALLALKQ